MHKFIMRIPQFPTDCILAITAGTLFGFGPLYAIIGIFVGLLGIFIITYQVFYK
jgi:hypothetical protein